MKPQPLFIVAETSPVTRGEEPTLLTTPLPYKEASDICYRLNLERSEGERFEIIEKAFAYTQKLRGFRKDAQERNLSLPTNFVRRSLLGVSKDAKTVKGESFGFLTGILYLSPLDLGGFGNVCPFASKGCAADCLNSAGRGAFNSVQKARREKTALFFKANASFLCNLALDILALQRKAFKLGLKPVVRLNGTSDIAWEKLKVNGFNLFQLFPLVSFYDYTKNPERALSNAQGKHPKNYRVVFSRSETNESDCEKVLKFGGNVAVVFRKDLPKRYLGKRVIIGDESDLRFLDPKGCVVGLTAKGKAKKSTSGFVVSI